MPCTHSTKKIAEAKTRVDGGILARLEDEHETLSRLAFVITRDIETAERSVREALELAKKTHQCGTGGTQLASLMARKFGWELVDHLLVDRIARIGDLDFVTAAHFDAQAASWWRRLRDAGIDPVACCPYIALWDACSNTTSANHGHNAEEYQRAEDEDEQESIYSPPAGKGRNQQCGNDSHHSNKSGCQRMQSAVNCTGRYSIRQVPYTTQQRDADALPDQLPSTPSCPAASAASCAAKLRAQESPLISHINVCRQAHVLCN